MEGSEQLFRGVYDIQPVLQLHRATSRRGLLHLSPSDVETSKVGTVIELASKVLSAHA